MNTQRSDKLVADFLEAGGSRNRKIQTYERKFNHPARAVFFQLCPARERDWIPGWDCRLVYTRTGYIEQDCVFTTDESNSLGAGVWIVTQYRPDEVLELVRVVDMTLVIHLRLKLHDNGDGTSTANWQVTYTALNAAGDELVQGLPDQLPGFVKAIEGLEYYLEHGELMAG